MAQTQELMADSRWLMAQTQELMADSRWLMAWDAHSPSAEC